jgi:hypothetical protein
VKVERMRHADTENFITSQDKNAIISTINSLLGDVDYSASLIYEQFISTSFSATTQTIDTTWTRTACNGVRGKYNFEELSLPGIEKDDIFWMIPQSSFSVPKEVEEGKEDSILEKYYSAGTVNVTNGSSSVIRYNDSLDFDLARGGDVIRVGGSGEYYDIKNTAEATLTLMNNYEGSTATNEDYILYRRWRVYGIDQDMLKIIYKIKCRGL